MLLTHSLHKLLDNFLYYVLQQLSPVCFISILEQYALLLISAKLLFESDPSGWQEAYHHLCHAAVSICK